MNLGTFSMSLAVKDIEKSKVFYEKLGFEVFAGDQSQNYLIMKNGETNIGLFQGMFENNILTFNPGWDSDAKALEQFTDIREIHRNILDKGVALESESIAGESGRSSFMLTDPDGNSILIDQHV
ncbi:VOC family protein [Gammaproteobacteria bacterium]|nr:VOC family protein [Gammaproteobacteria bacterium]